MMAIVIMMITVIMMIAVMVTVMTMIERRVMMTLTMAFLLAGSVSLCGNTENCRFLNNMVTTSWYWEPIVTTRGHTEGQTAPHQRITGVFEHTRWIWGSK